MFQSIEDVQLQTHDPYYEEVDPSEMPTSARDNNLLGAHGRRTLDPLSSAGTAQANILTSLNGGQNMQS